MPTKTSTKSASSNLSKGGKPVTRKPVEKPARSKTASAKANDAKTTGPLQARQDLDIEYFKGLLLTERARLEEEREQIRSSALDVDGALPDEGEGGEEDTADLASSMMDKEMNLSVEDEIEDLLATVDRALQKIEEGTYGICDISGEKIPQSRLEIIPWAALTVECQALSEE
ncbi:MAG: TraR/DksA C4-type zinc finger protein [Abitibacteriaceae bacterium]|nr:TraR/DksA C4-type zinc finger protein [Abditibacteriaceae bacterium]